MLEIVEKLAGGLSMALLERVNQLQGQGYQDQQISQMLQEEGNSPKDVNEALSQSKVKAAVAAPEPDGMQASSMPNAPEAYPSTVPVPQAAPEAAPQTMAPAAYPQEQAYAPVDQGQAAAYPAEGYGQDQYYPQALDTETVRDIAKQIVEEELSKLQTDIKEISKLKTDLKFQIQSLDNRLTKIEGTISQLQSDIIKKVGEYGESISDISSEMRATQDSFSKMINPLIDKKRKAEPSPEPKKALTTRKTTKKTTTTTTSKPGFESYFR